MSVIKRGIKIENSVGIARLTANPANEPLHPPGLYNGTPFFYSGFISSPTDAIWLLYGVCLHFLKD